MIPPTCFEIHTNQNVSSPVAKHNKYKTHTLKAGLILAPPVTHED